MNVLLVRNFAQIDGTLTLLVRIARSLEAMGHKAYLLFLSGIDPKVASELQDNVTLLSLADLERMHREKSLPAIDVIHGVVSGDALLLTYSLLKRTYFPDAAVVMGAYHPLYLREPRGVPFTPDAILHRAVMRRIPEANLTFMNDAVQAYVASYFKRKFQHSPIIPLPVKVPRSYVATRPVNRNKLVSVGRLVGAKSYPLGVLDAVDALRKEGVELEYHIYGSGPLQGAIEAKIKALGLEDSVLLHGDIQYSQVAGAMGDALLFIGMGTSVIEACAVGLPALLAVGAREEVCYGLFHEVPGYTVGEPMAGLQEQDYASAIRKVIHADETAYADLCRKSHAKAATFSEEQVMQQYFDFYKNADRKYAFRAPAWLPRVMKIARQPFKLLPRKFDF